MKPLKRDPVNVTPLPDTATVLGSIAGWFEDYTETTRTRSCSCARHASLMQRIATA